MSQFKKCKVVMLPTNKKAGPISIGNKSGIAEYHIFQHEKSGIYNNHTFQHLYFFSDEEIKVGDWIYRRKYGYETIQKATLPLNLISVNKKIIAATDTLSILVDDGYLAKESPSGKVLSYLPQPSQSFIEKFVEEYNKGNVITEVLVEYETITKRYGSCSIGEGVTMNVKQLKVSKDNTITIRKVKDSWNREEVIALITKFNWDANVTNDIWKDEWIEENL